MALEGLQTHRARSIAAVAYQSCVDPMIKDVNVKAEIAEEWIALNTLVNWSRGWMAGGTFVNETPPESFFNLPLVLAYSTLDHALAQFIIEEHFVCKKEVLL
jgi:hypothetical protein